MKKFNILFAFVTICFSAFSQAPTITSFSPASGPVGTLVTIRGTNLSSPTAFTVGGVTAIIISNSSDSIVGMVMPGAVSGGVSVTTAGGTYTSGSSFTITPTVYPSTQQGTKLVGTGAIGPANQGWTVAISADGNTAVVGGRFDDNGIGAVWIYSRSGNTWIQQGTKLVGTGYSQTSEQGESVAISADGNTVIVGGAADNVYKGAVWVYTRSGTSWIQQGSKLIGTGTEGPFQYQGQSVALSADGNTAIVGGPADSSNTGAAWVFTRSGSIWTQQGPKLVGTGDTGITYQGYSVSISADGNTAIVSGYNSNNVIEPAWIFTRSGGIWTQQGNKLVGTGAINGTIGPVVVSSVSLSADGNTAIVGGAYDNNSIGAAWVFTRSGNTWTQQGSKLVGTGVIGAAQLGSSVSLSADGNIAMVGGYTDSTNVGALWVYMRSNGTWLQQGNKLIGTGAVNGGGQGYSVSLSADGNTAIEGGMQDSSGMGAAWVFSLSCSPNSSTTYDTLNSDMLPYLWNGLTFTGSSSKTAQLIGSSGCDSAATLILTVDWPKGISEIKSTSTIHLYPNPNKGSFTLQTSASIGSDYTISDMLGHVIMQQSIRSDNEIIELPDAAEGVYILTVKGAQPIRFAVLR